MFALTLSRPPYSHNFFFLPFKLYDTYTHIWVVLSLFLGMRRPSSGLELELELEVSVIRRSSLVLCAMCTTAIAYKNENENGVVWCVTVSVDAAGRDPRDPRVQTLFTVFRRIRKHLKNDSGRKYSAISAKKKTKTVSEGVVKV